MFEKLNKLSEQFFVLRNSLDKTAITPTKKEKMMNEFEENLNSLTASVAPEE